MNPGQCAFWGTGSEDFNATAGVLLENVRGEGPGEKGGSTILKRNGEGLHCGSAWKSGKEKGNPRGKKIKPIVLRENFDMAEIAKKK